MEIGRSLFNNKNEDTKLKILYLITSIHREISTNTDEGIQDITDEGIKREYEPKRKNRPISKDKKTSTNSKMKEFGLRKRRMKRLLTKTSRLYKPKNRRSEHQKI